MKPVDNHVARPIEYETVNCYYCDGTGKVTRWKKDSCGEYPVKVTCEPCGGTGKYKVEA